jgi:hypothetical protein
MHLCTCAAGECMQQVPPSFCAGAIGHPTQLRWPAHLSGRPSMYNNTCDPALLVTHAGSAADCTAMPTDSCKLELQTWRCKPGATVSHNSGQTGHGTNRTGPYTMSGLPSWLPLPTKDGSLWEALPPPSPQARQQRLDGSCQLVLGLLWQLLHGPQHLPQPP